MELKESGEMYLETIYVLSKRKGFVRSIDVVEEMGYSKPSVSRAMGILRDGGYITVGADGGLNLTEAGLEVAGRSKSIYKKIFKGRKTAPFFLRNNKIYVTIGTSI